MRQALSDMPRKYHLFEESSSLFSLNLPHVSISRTYTAPHY